MKASIGSVVKAVARLWSRPGRGRHRPGPAAGILGGAVSSRSQCRRARRHRRPADYGSWFRPRFCKQSWPRRGWHAGGAMASCCGPFGRGGQAPAGVVATCSGPTVCRWLPSRDRAFAVPGTAGSCLVVRCVLRSSALPGARPADRDLRRQRLGPGIVSRCRSASWWPIVPPAFGQCRLRRAVSVHQAIWVVTRTGGACGRGPRLGWRGCAGPAGL
jgi:hypothetical protein